MASRTKYRHRMRCTNTRKCGRRFTLRRHPDSYVRRSKVLCPSCGGQAYSDEKTRKAELAKQETCMCPSIPFPHRLGSILGCDHHPKPTEDWTDEDQWQYEAMWNTPRSG